MPIQKPKPDKPPKPGPVKPPKPVTKPKKSKRLTLAGLKKEIDEMGRVILDLVDANATNKGRDKRMARTVKDITTDIKAKQDELVADLASTKNVVAAIERLVKGKDAQMAALREQIKELQANAADPTEFEGLLTTITEIERSNQEVQDRLVAATLEGTEADPNA